MYRTLCATICTAMLAAGCSSSSPRLNAPPHGVADSVHDMQGTFVYMTDNALLADMSVSDMHFLPHRAMLTTLGEQRLNRLAQLINAYGGTIRFNSNLNDDVLIDKRLTATVDYLSESGIDTSSEVVSRGMRGGSGMDATEVILIKENEGTYDPTEAASNEGAVKSLVGGGS